MSATKSLYIPFPENAAVLAFMMSQCSQNQFISVSSVWFKNVPIRSF